MKPLSDRDAAHVASNRGARQAWRGTCFCVSVRASWMRGSKLAGLCEELELSGVRRPSPPSPLPLTGEGSAPSIPQDRVGRERAGCVRRALVGLVLGVVAIATAALATEP